MVSKHSLRWYLNSGIYVFLKSIFSFNFCHVLCGYFPGRILLGVKIRNGRQNYSLFHSSEYTEQIYIISVVCVCVCVCMCVSVLTQCFISLSKLFCVTYFHSVNYSVMSDSVTPWTVACQAPLSMEFSSQEYWSGLPFFSRGHLPKRDRIWVSCTAHGLFTI